MKNKLILLAFINAFWFLTSSAQAIILNVSGTFSASGADAPVPDFSGTFSFAFDDSAVGGSGSEVFDLIPLSGLTFSPVPLGATTFDTTNSGGRLEYFNGQLDIVVVGGLLNGVGSANLGTDDWLFSWRNDGTGAFSPYVVGATIAPDGISEHSEASGALSFSVPEPATLVLFGLGVAGIGYQQRRQIKAA